jgi:hypothetical protein
MIKDLVGSDIGCALLTFSDKPLHLFPQPRELFPGHLDRARPSVHFATIAFPAIQPVVHAATLQARTCRFNPVAETGGPANSIRIASGAFDFEPLRFASATHEFSRTAISLEQSAGGFHGAFDERPRSFA